MGLGWRRIVKKTPYEKHLKWKSENIDAWKAHKLIFIGVRNGSIKKGICFCGEKKVQAHHEDYSKPLDIIWLCKKHHVVADKERRTRLTK